MKSFLSLVIHAEAPSSTISVWESELTCRVQACDDPICFSNIAVYIHMAESVDTTKHLGGPSSIL